MIAANIPIRFIRVSLRITLSLHPFENSAARGIELSHEAVLAAKKVVTVPSCERRSALEVFAFRAVQIRVLAESVALI
jgi:hypothetical protein